MELRVVVFYVFFLLSWKFSFCFGGKTWGDVATTLRSKTCTLVGMECCVPPFAQLEKGIPILRKRLKEEFYGQHLALETTLTSLDAHLRDPKPGKALVLSFHGWAGSGKTYLVEHIAKALYRNGINSKYVKMYMASLDFGDESKVQEYKEQVQYDIESTVKSCEHAMFVFDEVDKTPPKLFDAVIPYISHPQLINGYNHKKSIFIFMSNTGASAITAVTLQAWKVGRNREDLTFRDYEEYLSKEAFNRQENGLYHSGLIDKMLVDYFIPFLPLERKHVIQCAKLEGKRHSEEINAENVANSITYWPPDLKIYSQSGCRKVEGAVKYQLSQKRFQEGELNCGEDEEECNNEFDENDHEEL